MRRFGALFPMMATDGGTIDLDQCSPPVPEEAPIRIEETQAALREGIERAKAMVHDYERLIRAQPAEADEAKPLTAPPG